MHWQELKKILQNIFSMKTVKPSIIKDSMKIRKLLKMRFEELGVNYSRVVEDANMREMKFTNSSLSRFMKSGNVNGSLTEENIIWLCFRWGIEIQLLVGTPKVANGKVELTLPPYNEEKCLLILEKLNLNGKK